MDPNTGAYFSCSATLNGEMFVFGGETNHKTQVCYAKLDVGDTFVVLLKHSVINSYLLSPTTSPILLGE